MPRIVIFDGALVAFLALLLGCGRSMATTSAERTISRQTAAPVHVRLEPTAELAPPIRLEADGKPINIGELSSIAHAGPWIADVDQDGDRDLLVGDFPGYFWLFDNIGTSGEPKYASRGKLQAGGTDAKTPVY